MAKKRKPIHPPRLPLFMVRRDEEAHEYIDDDSAGADTARSATDADMTPEALADFLSQQAENANYHNYCYVYPVLATILTDVAGIDAAREVLRRIIDRGGFPGIKS